MAIFNPKHLDKIINKVGNVIVIAAQKDITYDDWGNEYSNLSSNVTTVAIVNDISGNEEFNREGQLVADDKIFFFKSTETALSNEAQLIFDGSIYNIIKIIPYKAEDTQQQYEVWAKRI